MPRSVGLVLTPTLNLRLPYAAKCRLTNHASCIYNWFNDTISSIRINSLWTPAMMVTLDFRSRDPIYLQIVAQVKQMTATGLLKPGAQLPTIRQLATDLRVNFNTVARAYRMLDEEGVISTQQGRGTYILEQPIPVDQRRLRRQQLTELTTRFLTEAVRLGYTAAEISESLAAGLIVMREEPA